MILFDKVNQMANIYITDETRKNLERAAELDHRTLDGEVNHLCQERVKQLKNVRDFPAASPQAGINSNTSASPSQEKKQ
jgi:hypothetical protein